MELTYIKKKNFHHATITAGNKHLVHLNDLSFVRGLRITGDYANYYIESGEYHKSSYINYLEHNAIISVKDKNLVGNTNLKNLLTVRPDFDITAVYDLEKDGVFSINFTTLKPKLLKGKKTCN